MSLYDELIKPDSPKSDLTSYKNLIDEMVSQISSICLEHKNEHRLCGYLHGASDDYGPIYGVSMDLPVHRTGRDKYHSDCIFPQGCVWDFPAEARSYMEEEIRKLGFKNYVFRFEKIELEIETLGFMHKIVYRPSGKYSYRIYMDLNW